jgi:hypothetical protein
MTSSTSYRTVLVGKTTKEGKHISEIHFKLSSVDDWAKRVFLKLTDDELKSCYVEVYETKESKLREIRPPESK